MGKKLLLQTEGKKLIPILVVLISLIVVISGFHTRFAVGIETPESYLVFGYISYNNGLPAPNGVNVTFTNTNNENTYTMRTTTSGTNTSGFYKLEDTRSITGTENGHVINISVTYAGNTGYQTFTNGDSDMGFERVDITISGNLPPSSPRKPSGTILGETGATYAYSANAVDPENDQLQYIFSWDDNTTDEWTQLSDSGVNTSASHSWTTSGNYQIRVKAQDEHGAQRGISEEDNITYWSAPLNVTITAPPSVSFSYTPSNPLTRDVVQFSDESTDADGTISSWEWDFDDGNTSTQQNPTHQYTNKGNYSVTLTVTDNQGATSSSNTTIVVNNTPPTPSFTFSPTNPRTGSSIQFTDQSSDYDGNVTSWFWEFGDGTNSTEQNTTHSYESKGTYLVNLTVTDNDNITNQTSINITVKKTPASHVNQPPNAQFTFTPRNPMANTTISFTDQSTDLDGAILSWQWDFGDGTTSTKQHPKHSYTQPGSYQITLTVTDNDQQTKTKKSTVHVVNEATNTIALTYSSKNNGVNYVAWQGENTSAAALAISMNLSEGETISKFNVETGEWQPYYAGSSNITDDFTIATYDILRIHCIENRQVRVDMSKSLTRSRTVQLKHLRDKHNNTSNYGYNYVVWTGRHTVQASDLAHRINLAPNWFISKYDEKTAKWQGYIAGLGTTSQGLDFTISPGDVLCIKISESKTLEVQ